MNNYFNTYAADHRQAELLSEARQARLRRTARKHSRRGRPPRRVAVWH
jgi:hypothetical protein